MLSHDPTGQRRSAWPTPEPSEGRSEYSSQTVPVQSKYYNGSYPQSDPAERRISFASSGSSADTLRASPLLPSMSGLRPSPQNGLYEMEDSDPVTLPSLFGNDRRNSSNYASRERPPLQNSRRETTQSYPPMFTEQELPSPQTMSYSSFPYSQHRHASDSGQVAMSMDGHSQYTSGHQQLNFEMVGDYPDHRNKRRRGNLPKAVTDILRAWFHDHISHPYPSEDEKQILIERTGLSISQVSKLEQ